MAKKVTNEDILHINEIYYQTHTYAETARQVGFSAATVKRYVIPGWEPVTKTDIKKFEMSQLPEFTTDVFMGIENYGDLCVLSEKEVKEIEELWGELAI